MSTRPSHAKSHHHATPTAPKTTCPWRASPCWFPVVASKHHAAPQSWMPAESTTANNRCRCYDNRCRGRYDNRRRGGDYARAFIGPASSVGGSVKARATTAFRTSAVEENELERDRFQSISSKRSGANLLRARLERLLAHCHRY